MAGVVSITLEGVKDWAPLLAPLVVVCGVIWKGFRLLSRIIDNTDRVPHVETKLGAVETKVDTALMLQDEDRTTLRKHMADEQDKADAIAAIVATESKARAEGQAGNAERLDHIDGRLATVETQLARITR